jgi:hypothetical protein
MSLGAAARPLLDVETKEITNMTTKTNLKAGRRANNNETLVRDTQGLKLKTRIRAGRLNYKFV